MTRKIKRAICFLLSTAFVLSTIVTAGIATCSSAAAASATVMACCIEHATPGIANPCCCVVKSAPATAPQSAAIERGTHHDIKYVTDVEPETFATFKQEPINARWLAMDTRLRAPPLRLYIVKCSFLK